MKEREDSLKVGKKKSKQASKQTCKNQTDAETTF